MADDRQFITALARGLALLECFRPDKPVLTNGELAEMSGLACSSVSRLTHTLIKLGYLDYDPDAGSYRLGLKVLSLQQPALAGTGISDVIGPHMAALAERSGETVLLTVYDNYGLIAVRIDSRCPTVVTSRFVGWRYPILGTSMGRAYIACCSAPERQKILAHLTDASHEPPADMLGEVESAIASYRELGYCTALSVARPGKHGAAVTMNLPHLGQRLVLTCSGPSHRITPHSLHGRIAPMLVESAAKIEADRAVRAALPHRDLRRQALAPLRH